MVSKKAGREELIVLKIGIAIVIGNLLLYRFAGIALYQVFVIIFHANEDMLGFLANAGTCGVS